MPDSTAVLPVYMSVDTYGNVTEGDSVMAYTPAQEIGDKLHEQTMTSLGQIGNLAQGNIVTVSKAFDYDYLEGKRLVDLGEALGAREVASEKNPGGPSKP
jgi:hypothetical protein